MFRSARGVPDGGLLGAMQTNQDGANTWVERIVGRGWGKLQPALGDRADRPGPGERQPGGGDSVATRRPDRRDRGIPVDAGGRKWRPLLVAYVLMMAFTLVYTAEHYVVDILLGWACGRRGRHAIRGAAPRSNAVEVRARLAPRPDDYDILCDCRENVTWCHARHACRHQSGPAAGELQPRHVAGARPRR